MPWLSGLGVQRYASNASIRTHTARIVTLIPYESVVTAGWKDGRASWNSELELQTGIRMSESRQTWRFFVPVDTEVTPCKPRAKGVKDDDEDVETKKAKSDAALSYNSVFIQARGPKGLCQLRFILQDDESIRVTIESLGTSQWR